MKALSLSQPWASLMFDGRKTVETRSWAAPNSLIGKRFAIHAAKSIDEIACWRFGYKPSDVPRGALLCTVEFIGCLRTPFKAGAVELVLRGNRINPLELQYGDFEDDRYAWFTCDVQKFEAPAPMVGHLGLWECVLPEVTA